ncbi:MAG: hypothetical protein ACREX9_06835, partial [Gammaproteobacteria bacterium]
LETLKGMVGKSGDAKKLLAAEEKLAAAETAIAWGETQKLLKEEADKAKQALAAAKQAKKKGVKGTKAAVKKKASPAGSPAQKQPAAKEKGPAQEAAKPKSSAQPESGNIAPAKVAPPVRELVDSAMAEIQRRFPKLKSRIDSLLHPEDWERLMSLINRYRRSGSLAAYEGLLRIVQGELFELIVPRMPEFKEALKRAATRAALAPGTWSEVRVTRLVEALGPSGARRKFTDFVFWAEGLDQDNKGYTLLLAFIEAKSGGASDLFSKIVMQGRRKVKMVGQLGAIEQRLRNRIWLDRSAVPFEKMVYVLPSADLAAGSRLTEYIAVMQRPPTWEEVAELVTGQRLNADVWLGPVNPHELRSVSDLLLTTAGKAPEVAKGSVRPLAYPLAREAVRSATDAGEPRESETVPTP